MFSKNVNTLLKEKKIPKYIIDDIEISCDTNEENSDKETLLDKIQAEKNSDYEENSDKEILKKKNQTEKHSHEENSSKEN